MVALERFTVQAGKMLKGIPSKSSNNMPSKLMYCSSHSEHRALGGCEGFGLAVGVRVVSARPCCGHAIRKKQHESTDQIVRGRRSHRRNNVMLARTRVMIESIERMQKSAEKRGCQACCA